MFEQLFPILIVFGGVCVYLLLWNESLKRREVLKEKVLCILNEVSYSTALKRKVLNIFVCSGRHFFVTTLLYKTFKLYLIKSFSRNPKKKSSIKKNKIDGYESEIYSQIFSKSMTVNFILSPLQLLFAMVVFLIIKSLNFDFSSDSLRKNDSVLHMVMNDLDGKV